MKASDSDKNIISKKKIKNKKAIMSVFHLVAKKNLRVGPVESV